MIFTTTAHGKGIKSGTRIGLVLMLAVMAVLPVKQATAFWPFDKGKTYTITGLEKDKDTESYLQTILNNRFSQKIEAKTDKDKAYIRAYQERLAIADLQKAMKSRGYYGASVTYDDNAQDKKNGVYTISAGARTVITSIKIVPQRYAKILAKMPVKQGDALIADNVLKGQNDLFEAIQKHNCTFNLSVRNKVIMAPKSGKADLVYTIDAGKEAKFDGVTFSGMKKTKQAYLQKFVPWKEGDCFRRSKINDLREKLLSTGLFSKADVILPPDVLPDGRVPVKIEVKERALRSIRAGASYYTDEGVGVTLGWEHRNFLGNGEKFNADLSMSMLEQSLKAKLAKPYFIRDDQTLSLNTAIGREDTDAYKKIATGGGFRISRVFTKRLSGRIGADIELTQITEKSGDKKNYGLFSPQIGLGYDSRDDTLDPHRGWLLSWSTQPFIDALGESSPFIKNELSAQRYYAVHKRIVFAGRVKFGSIAGTQNNDVPATERFFAGGGGSVRGFGYQAIGPHENGDPIGGRSLFESSAETRFKITEKIGAVAFVDVGTVDKNSLPAFDNLSVGTGLGARYYTSFGPLRFDVGVPLNNKDNLNQNFQIYISIGQAF